MRKKIFLFSTGSRWNLRPTPASYQFPRGYGGWGLKLVALFYLVPWLTFVRFYIYFMA
jgi:hypothetical protein